MSISIAAPWRYDGFQMRLESPPKTKWPEPRDEWELLGDAHEGEGWCLIFGHLRPEYRSPGEFAEILDIATEHEGDGEDTVSSAFARIATLCDQALGRRP